jgi:Protein kinase domain
MRPLSRHALSSATATDRVLDACACKPTCAEFVHLLTFVLLHTVGSSRSDVQVMSLVPPEQGTEDHPEWKRAGFEDEDAAKELHVFVSLYGIFKAPIDFPNEPGSWLVRLLCFSFKWTLQLLLQMAKGVVMCHQADVVHCDLEPWNFMFDAYGRLKIIDFGMSIRTVRAMRTARIL